MKRSEIERIVGGCDLFKGLAKNNIGKIAGLCHVETYSAGEKGIFARGFWRASICDCRRSYRLREINGLRPPQGKCSNWDAL